MKKNILIIIPDRFVKASGGMGENSAPLFRELSSKYDFYAVGFPLAGTEVPDYLKGYHEALFPFTEVNFGPLNTIIAQTVYFKEAVTFPKPDLIYAFDWSIYLAATQAAEFFDVPMIARMCLSPILLAEQGYSFGLNLSNPAEKAIHDTFCEMEIRGLKQADGIIHVSKGYAKQYEHIAPHFAEKTSFVINGIDLEKWQNPEIVSATLPGTRPIKVVFLGRLAEMKGIIPLCEANVPDSMDLIFVGDKNKADRVCWNAIEKKMQENDNVHYIGPMYGEDKIRTLRAADVVIVPSYQEPFGGVGLEGLASGSIVISTRTGGLGDYLTDETSIHCAMNAAGIEQAYATYLAMTDAERAAMRDAGFAMCKKLTIGSAAGQLDRAFEKCI